MDDQVIGPTLPPGFTLENKSSDSEEEDVIGPSAKNSNKSGRDSTIGPSSPLGLKTTNKSNRIGPSLPPGFKLANDNFSSDEEDSFGPALPPGLKTANHKNEDVVGPSIGPQVPIAMGKLSSVKAKSEDDSDDDEGFMGPALPPGFKISKPKPVVKGPMLIPGYAMQSKGDNSESEGEDYMNIVGPLPQEMAQKGQKSSVMEEFEKRANSMKDKLTKKDDDAPLARESWMLELPPEMGTNFGLSARKFRTNPSTKGGDRSCWTDTPADKARKEKEGSSSKSKSTESQETQIMSARDKKIAEQVNQYNQHKRKESLLEMHQTERKKKKKEDKEGQANVRRPFDRDRDLQVNRFDDAQRKSVIKKSQKLNTRFSHGGSQFL